MKIAEEGSLLYVPEDLEERILVRLPIKSILRFKSICKRWHSLLSSKAFEELYFGFLDKEAFIPTNEDLGLICPQLRRRGRRSKRYETSVIGPLSNGIYALTSFLLTPRKQPDNPHVLPHTLKIALFNPATRQVKFAVPFPDEYHNLLSGISSSSCNVYCGIDDGYRVVVLINYGGRIFGRNCSLVFFYTWRTGEWEKLVDYDPYRRRIGLPRGTHVFKYLASVYDNMMACPQKLLNGCWHWMILTDNEYFGFGVLSFDFERKSLELIDGPPFRVSFQADVFVLQDHLAAIVLSDYDNLFEIWRKTKAAWSNIYSVDSTQFAINSRIIVHNIDCYQVEEEVSIRRLILDDNHEFHIFDDDDEEFDLSDNKISLSVGGISKFTPTFEPLPL